MPVSAIIVKVPEAEALVGQLRDRFDATASLGVPAHITILFPFMPPDDIRPDVMRDIQTALDAVSTFSYALETIERFEQTVYLAPEPAQPFMALTASVARHFPAFPPYAGVHAGVVPHLTVAQGNATDVETAAEELEQQLSRFPEVRAECGSVFLIENSSGRWKDMHEFKLLNHPKKPVGNQ
jgi:2'-5' RNA ligase